jgi:hypothetical protein
MTIRSVGAAGLFGVLAGVALLAAPAFACSDSPSITSLPGFGPAGSEVTITGQQFTTPDTAGPVVIRWNSMTGTQLGSAAGMSFSVRVTIPANARGFNYLVAVQEDKATGAIVGKASTVFEVQAAAAVPAEPGEVPAGTPAPVPAASTPADPVAPGPVVALVASGAQAPAPAPAQAPAQAVGAPSAPVSSAATGTPAAGTPGTAGPGPSAAPGGRATPARPSPPAVTTGASSAVEAVSGTPVAIDQDPLAASDAAVADLPATVNGRGWGTVLARTEPPSLFDASVADEGRHDATQPVGAALLCLSLLTLAGVGVVAGQRRLALARRPGTR